MDAVQPTRSRLIVAAALVAVMLSLACVGVGAFFGSELDFDGEASAAGRLVGRGALVSAVALYLGTGPCAWLISRRRWTIATPIGVAVLAAVAVGVASST